MGGRNARRNISPVVLRKIKALIRVMTYIIVTLFHKTK